MSKTEMIDFESLTFLEVEKHFKGRFKYIRNIESYFEEETAYGLNKISFQFRSIQIRYMYGVYFKEIEEVYATTSLEGSKASHFHNRSTGQFLFDDDDDHKDIAKGIINVIENECIPFFEAYQDLEKIKNGLLEKETKNNSTESKKSSISVDDLLKMQNQKQKESKNEEQIPMSCGFSEEKVIILCLLKNDLESLEEYFEELDHESGLMEFVSAYDIIIQFHPSFLSKKIAKSKKYIENLSKYKELNTLIELDFLPNEPYKLPKKYLSNEKPFHTDGKSVFIYDDSDGEGPHLVKKADVGTFRPFPGAFASDKNNCYCFGDLIRGADCKSFEVLNFSFAKDKSKVFSLYGKIKNADAASFEVCDNGQAKGDSEINHMGYAKDKSQVYFFQTSYDVKVIKSALVDSFETVNSYGYAKDAKKVYFQGRQV